MLVTFENHRDKEDVFQASKCLRKSVISVTEDLSKKTRECRSELRKFMRHIKRTAPEKKCFLEYDKLYVDGKMFGYNEAVGCVEETSSENIQKTYQTNSVEENINSLERICCNASTQSLQDAVAKEMEKQIIELKKSGSTHFKENTDDCMSITCLEKKISDLECQLEMKDTLIANQLKLR